MSEIIFSSSYDEKHPPENILNPSKDKYFTSTGMFPQEICIQFETVKSVKSVSIVSYGIKKVSIQTCENDSVVNFKTQAEDICFLEHLSTSLNSDSSFQSSAEDDSIESAKIKND